MFIWKIFVQRRDEMSQCNSNIPIRLFHCLLQRTKQTKKRREIINHNFLKILNKFQIIFDSLLSLRMKSSIFWHVYMLSLIETNDYSTKDNCGWRNQAVHSWVYLCTCTIKELLYVVHVQFRWEQQWTQAIVQQKKEKYEFRGRISNKQQQQRVNECVGVKSSYVCIVRRRQGLISSSSLTCFFLLCH